MTDESIKEESGEEFIKRVQPTTKETYVILLDKKDPFVGEVIELNEVDNVVIIRNISNKNDSYIFLLEDGYLVMKSKKADYKIHDIERVIQFDLNILKKDTEQIQKQLTSDIIKELDISLEEIKEKDMVYTETELKEELLSCLTASFDAYDKLSSIQRIIRLVNDFFILFKKPKKDYLYTISKHKPLPKWLLPLVDNPIKIYTNDKEQDIEETVRAAHSALEVIRQGLEGNLDELLTTDIKPDPINRIVR